MQLAGGVGTATKVEAREKWRDACQIVDTPRRNHTAPCKAPGRALQGRLQYLDLRLVSIWKALHIRATCEQIHTQCFQVSVLSTNYYSWTVSWVLGKTWRKKEVGGVLALKGSDSFM